MTDTPSVRSRLALMHGSPVLPRHDAGQRLHRLLRLLRPLIEDGLAQLRAEWRRHLLTLLGIVWGSAAVVFLLSSGAGFYGFIDTGFKKTGDRHTFVIGEYTTAATGGARQGRRIELTRRDLERLQAGVPSAQFIAGQVVHGIVAVRTPWRTRSAVVAAITPDLQYIQELHVARGRFVDAADDHASRPVAVLGASIATIFFPQTDALGSTVQIEGRPFQVIGILARKGQQLMVDWAPHDDMIFIPLRAARPVFGQGDGVDVAFIKPRRLDDIPAMHAEVRATLAPWHHVSMADHDAVNLISVTEWTEPFRNIGRGLEVLLGFIGTVALAMAGVGVANLMVALVNERRMELAVRRACGARRSDLLLQLLIETLVIVAAGGVLGIALGLGISFGIGLLPLPDMLPVPRLSLAVILTTFGVLFAVAVGAGILPARLAARVDPGAAMRVT